MITTISMQRSFKVGNYMMQNQGSSKIFWSAIVILISLILILLRILPLGGPSIFSDEYLYGAWASTLHHGSSGIPPLDVALGNWLYLRVYSSVFIGMGSYLVKARILNAIFSALAAGALFQALHIVEPARKRAYAAILAIGFAVGLLGTYAGYFIPEAPYFGVTCVWLLCAVCYAQNRKFSLAVVTGVAGGVATMVKGHGLLLLPETILVFILAGVSTKSHWRKVASDTISMLVVWLVCCALVGFVLRNDTDLNPIGGFYGDTASGIMTHVASYLNAASLKLVLRYVGTLVVIFGLPLLICFWLAFVAVFRPRNSGYRAALLFSALLLCCAIAGFLIMSSVFTVAAVTPGSITFDPHHSLGRLDGGRYYEDFALLAACVGIVGSRTVLERWSWNSRVVVFVVLCVMLAGSWWVLRSVGWQNPNDFAVAYGLFSSPVGRYCALFLSVIGALLVVAWPKRAPAVLTCVLLAWLGFNLVRTEQLRWLNQEQAAGRVAAMVAETGNNFTSVEIVGAGATIAVYRAAFHLLDKEVGFALGPTSEVCDVAGRTPDWVIAVDGMRDPCGYSGNIQISDVVAARRNSPSVAVALPRREWRYHAILTLAEPPEMTADGGSISVIVDVTNDGKGTFGSSTTPYVVNLGAHSINSAGDIISYDLARGHLPQIAPGTSAKVSILLPVAAMLGHRAELLPVQESVAWFDKWGTNPLIVGPFKACTSPTIGKVCDTSGKPLKAAAPR